LQGSQPVTQSIEPGGLNPLPGLRASRLKGVPAVRFGLYLAGHRIDPGDDAALRIFGLLAQSRRHSNSLGNITRQRFRSGSIGADAILGHEAGLVGG